MLTLCLRQAYAMLTPCLRYAIGTLSLNLMLTYFEDPTLLAHRGFTVVHFSRRVELTLYNPDPDPNHMALTLTLPLTP